MATASAENGDPAGASIGKVSGRILYYAADVAGVGQVGFNMADRLPASIPVLPAGKKWVVFVSEVGKKIARRWTGPRACG